MKTSIYWKSKTSHFLGRNGYGKVTGLEISKTDYNPEDSGNVVWFTPITSKGSPARCEFSVPTEDIPELIKFLKKCV
jgi:hypothetical protein